MIEKGEATATAKAARPLLNPAFLVLACGSLQGRQPSQLWPTGGLKDRPSQLHSAQGRLEKMNRLGKFFLFFGGEGAEPVWTFYIPENTSPKSKNLTKLAPKNNKLCMMDS